jgi:prepilin peptidase CpaA
VQTIILVLAMGIFAAAAYGDVRTRRIPNALSYAVGSLGFIRMMLAGDPIAAGWTLAAAAFVLAVSFMFFWGGTFGGGDAKLLTGTTLLVGHHDLLDLLLLMGLCGAVLALALLVERRLHIWLRRTGTPATVPSSIGVAELSAARPTVPYGVAIAAAAAIILILQTSAQG